MFVGTTKISDGQTWKKTNRNVHPGGDWNMELKKCSNIPFIGKRTILQQTILGYRLVLEYG